MSENKVVKPVSFNKTKVEDQKRLKHLEGRNFSGYVKELIDQDIQKQEADLKIVQKSAGGGLKIIVGRR